MGKLKVVELFGGYGSQHLALSRIKNDNLIKDFDFEVVGVSEIEPLAVKSYGLLNGKVPQLGDITKIKELPDCDLLTYSFPCQDLSQANTTGEGLKGSRSGLVWEVIRLVRVKQPKYLLMENVTALLNKINIVSFEEVKRELETLGYSNHVQIINAKDVGSCQRRKRAFMVSILNGNGLFKFNHRTIYQQSLDKVLEDTRLNGKAERQKQVTSFFLKNEKLIDRQTPISKIMNCNFIFDSNSSSFGGYGFEEIPTLLKCTFAVSFKNIFDTRRMTPRTRYLAMGLNEEECDRILDSNFSETQHMANTGNSICIQPLVSIFIDILDPDNKIGIAKKEQFELF